MTSNKEYEKVEYKFVACDYCGTSSYKNLFNGSDYRSFSAKALTVVQCYQCGLVYLNPRPKNMTDYYCKNCYGKKLEKDFFSWLSLNRGKKIAKLKKAGKILDIGCGDGKFLLSMRKKGWEVYGNDICKNACDYIRSKLNLNNVYSGQLLSIDLPEKYFDVITLWHVLEHLEKPRENLKKINKLLKDDGILVIESPDFSSIHRILFKDKWQALELPQHLYQFSERTVENILKLAGFEIYKKDFIIDPRVSYVDLKESILRWLGFRKPVRRNLKEEENTSADISKRSISWKVFRFILNWFCFIMSSLLIFINCKDLFRIYCKKMQEKDLGLLESKL